MLQPEITIEEIEASNDWAVCSGKTLGYVISKSDSSKTSVNDKYAMILKTENSEWKISGPIWNKTESR